MTTIRTFRKNTKDEKRRPVIQKRKAKITGPTEVWCRPRIIYSTDGKSILTTSKWYKNAYTCIFDWMQRGFLVIEDIKIGGGFEYKAFPKLEATDITSLIERYNDRFKGEKK